MLQVQDLVYTFNKDNIVNYERNLVESPFQSLPKPVSRHQSKYSVCQLNSKIHELVGHGPYNLRWIGNSPNSAVYAYMYCLLMLSVSEKNDLMQFKNVFYELCRKYLDVKEQKLLIQFLYLLQYSSDKYLFLKKYPLIDSIIFSVFQKLQAEQSYFYQNERDQSQQITDSSRFSNEERVSESINLEMQDSTTGQLFQMNKLAELYCKFGLKFHFLKWTKSSESSFLLTINQGRKMYIIVERQYFFVLQMLEKTQIKSTKSKLSKDDRIQVERLLSYSQTESEINCHQKLNHFADSTDKIQTKSKQDPYNTKHTVDSESNKKEILVCNPKNHTAVQISGQTKKQYKFPYFTKKINLKVEEIHQSIIHPKESPKKQLEYIDLMESSFEQQKVQQNNRIPVNKQVQQSQSPKFYTPKFFMKPFNSPVQSKNKKKSFDEKANKTETFVKRGRSPSQAEKKYGNNINGEKNKTYQKSKEMKFYSPPRLFSESPEKKNTNKLQIEQKKVHDIEVREKRKEDIRYFDKKYIEKKQEIHKNHTLKDAKSTDNDNIKKIQTSFLYNPKIINNRISLQSRNDLDLFSKYKIPTQDLVLNQIPEVDRSAEASRRELFDKKKVLREELAQSLNYKSQALLKKRLFEHLGTKFAAENLSFIPKKDSKLNKSLQSQQKHQKTQVQKIRSNQHNQRIKERNFEIQKECPQNYNENKLNSGFEIRIKYADSEHGLKNQ